MSRRSKLMVEIAKAKTVDSTEKCAVLQPTLTKAFRQWNGQQPQRIRTAPLKILHAGRKKSSDNSGKRDTPENGSKLPSTTPAVQVSDQVLNRNLEDVRNQDKQPSLASGDEEGAHDLERPMVSKVSNPNETQPSASPEKAAANDLDSESVLYFTQSEANLLNPNWIKDCQPLVEFASSSPSPPRHAFPLSCANEPATTNMVHDGVEKVKLWLFRDEEKEADVTQKTPKDVSLNSNTLELRKPHKEPNSHLNARTPEENSTVRDQNTSAGVVTTTRKELFPGSLIIPLDPATAELCSGVIELQPSAAAPGEETLSDIHPVPQEIIIETVRQWNADDETGQPLVMDTSDGFINIEMAEQEVQQSEEILNPLAAAEEIEISEEGMEEMEQNLAVAPRPTRKRKSAVPEHTPPKKKMPTPSQWIINIRKNAANSGKAFVNKDGKQRNARSLKPGCGSKCKRNCESKITTEMRQQLFDKYWSLADKGLQWFFLAKLACKIPIVRRRVILEDEDDAYRKVNYEYRLKNLTTGEIHLVCKTMFINTFDISITVVKSALNKNSPDKRGKNENSRKRLPPALVEGVRNHIKQFPVMKSHYCRVDSRKRYLDTHLSVAKMHRMYVAERENMPFTANERQYRDIFNTSFNLGFFKPKKDRCGDCAKWDSVPENQQSEENREKHLKHIHDKELVRNMRREDKVTSRETDKTLVVATFDMQSVFFCPKTEVSGSFYKSKLSCYNFTVFDCSDKEGACYVWDQSIGGKGADEIASFLFSWIEEQVAKGKKVFRFYSDSCGPQNKNQFLYSMYYLAVMKFGVTICHRYLVKGHTQMECDSVHARIEKKTKKEEIYTPAQWYGHIKTAKVKKPAYRVIEIKRENIFSFRPLATEFNWDKQGVSTFREITFSSSTPGKASVRRDLMAVPKEVSILIPRRGRPINWLTYKPNLAYEGRRVLKAILVEAIKWFIRYDKIPAVHVPFYESLLQPAPVEVDAPDSSDEEGDDEPELVNSGDVYENEDDDADDPKANTDDSDDSEDENNGNTTDSDAYD